LSFDVAVQGLAPLLAALREYPEIARPELEQAASAALLSLIPSLADYPAAPGNSTYRRTGNLGRMWTAARPEFAPMQSGFEASIGNSASYGPFVQGDEQAKMHQGRWKTAQAIAEAHQAEIERYFEGALDRVAQKLDNAT
jgi:hypothetical protein